MSFCISKIIGIVEDIIQGLENARWVIKNIEKYTVSCSIRRFQENASRKGFSNQLESDFILLSEILYLPESGIQVYYI